MYEYIEKGVCKTVRSLGLTPVRTRKIVDGVSFALRHNGPDWVLSRVKALRDFYAGTGAFPAWVSYKHRRSDYLVRPKGWMGYLVGNERNLDTVVCLCSSVIGAITYEQPTDKQLDKWYKAVADPPKADALHSDRLKDVMPSMAHLEDNLKKKLEQLQAFGPDNVSGSNIPVGYDSLRIRRGKKLDVRGIYDAYIRSLESAPANSWSFLDQSGIRIPGVKMDRARVMINHARKSAPDFRPKKTDRKLSSGTYPIGHVNFLQKPFGKLRTVANPNRFVQWELTPLGEVLSDWVNRQPGVYVTNQEGAMQWAQDRLKRCTWLTSADLSSASDTLDYRQITAVLKTAGPQMRKHLEYFEWCSSRSWYVEDETARSYLDRRGHKSPTIQWRQGQPLGLRPSFPVMTLCNLLAARAAVVQVDGRMPTPDDTPFAIVGDDIIIETKYATAYSEAITDMGGIANLEKSLTSNVQAEICSRLVRPNRILRLKPRYLFDNDPQNLITYQDTSLRVRCKGWVRDYAKQVGSYSLIESGLVPLYHGSQPKRISTRDLFHTVQSLSREEAAMETEMSSLSMWYAYQHSISRISENDGKSRRTRKPTRKLKDSSFDDKARMFRKWNEGVITLEELPIRLGLVKKRYGTSWDHWMSEALRALETSEAMRALVPEVRWVRDPEYERIHAEIEAESARMQTVNSVKTEYDYRSDSFKTVEKPENQLRRLHRSVESFESGHITDEAGDHWIAPVIAPSSSNPKSRRVGPTGVDVLVEDKGDHYELSYHSQNQSSEPVTVEKTVPELKDFDPIRPVCSTLNRIEEAENLLPQSSCEDEDDRLAIRP